MFSVPEIKGILGHRGVQDIASRSLTSHRGAAVLFMPLCDLENYSAAIECHLGSPPGCAPKEVFSSEEQFRELLDAAFADFCIRVVPECDPDQLS